MDKTRVIAALETLESELAGAEELDADARAALEKAAAEIRRRVELAPPEREEDESAAGQLHEAILEFETEHPRLSGAIRQVTDALANLGI